MDQRVMIITALKALYAERAKVDVTLGPELPDMARLKRQANHDRITATIEWLSTLQEEASNVG